MTATVSFSTQTPAPPKKSKSGFLSAAFNFVASAGLGFAAGWTVKACAVTLGASQLATVGAAAVGVAATVTTFQRAYDVWQYNRTHEDKARFRDFEKTGHSFNHYVRRGALSFLFSGLGGLAGMAFGSNLFGDASPLCPETPVTATPEPTPPPAAIEPQAGLPDAPAPEPESYIQVEVLPPTFEDRLQDAIERAKAGIDCPPEGKLAQIYDRLGSDDPRISMQAVKDLAFAYAHEYKNIPEFNCVPHDDTVANELYKLVIEGTEGTDYGARAQAMHDLGYHTLYGKGTEIDYAQAHRLLSESGNKLSAPMLEYMAAHKLVPAGS